MFTDFTREEINSENVIELVYDLTDLDREILLLLSENEELTSSEIAEEVDKNQSTAYRSLEKLFEYGLIYKEKQTIRNGGYYFQYSLRPIDKIKEETLQYIEKLYDETQKAIKGMERDDLYS